MANKKTPEQIQKMKDAREKTKAERQAKIDSGEIVDKPRIRRTNRKRDPDKINIKEAIGVDWSKIKRVRIAFSGGKDSIALLLEAKRQGFFEKYDVDVLNYATCLEWRDLEEYINYVSKKVGVPITVLRDDDDESIKEQLCKAGSKNGPPFNFHYCNGIVKINILRQAKALKDYDMMVEGSRWSESVGRSGKTIFSERDGIISYKMIADWTANRVFETIKEAGIKLHWVYQYSQRLSCAMCPIGMYKKNPQTLFLVKKFYDKVNVKVYEAWYDSMQEVKWSKLNNNRDFFFKVQLLKKNLAFFKTLDPNSYELKVMNVPNCGYWHGPQDD
jgi:3'-phosphoadenosine 5'-phosphosulfate sulfotransferase (PAPS reductase)/FAD synthetase